jgi:hypothetical protein
MAFTRSGVRSPLSPPIDDERPASAGRSRFRDPRRASRRRAATSPASLGAALPPGRREGTCYPRKLVRLGDLLLADGLIAPDELAAAIAQQQTSGARLGSVLYLSGRMTADAVARALARQHGVPAALMRHLDGRDPTLAPRLPAELARRRQALPVALSRGRATIEPGGTAPPTALVVCMRDPGDAAAVAEIAAAVKMPVQAAVACAAVLAAHVARAYPADEDGDGVDVDFDEVSGTYSIPLGDMDPAALMLVDLDDKRVARDHTQTAPLPTVQRATGGLTAVTAADAERAQRSTAPPRGTVPPATAPAEPVLDGDAAIAELAGASSRDAVGDIALAFLRSSYAAGVVLVVRDGLALGHRGFGGSLTTATVESIVIPLNVPSVLRTAYDGGRPFIGAPPGDAGTIQDRFLRLLGSPREVVVAPVVLRDRPVCLVFAARPSRAADDALSDLLTVVAAMEEAYLRLIRDAKKGVRATTPPA